MADISSTNVKPLFVEHQPGPAVDDLGPSFQEIVTQLANLCGTRVLGLLAVIGAIGIFGFAVVDPTFWRTWTATAYALTVLLPIVMLYWRRG